MDEYALREMGLNSTEGMGVDEETEMAKETCYGTGILLNPWEEIYGSTGAMQVPTGNMNRY